MAAFFCLGRLCRLIAVGHAVRHSKRKNYQKVKQMPHSVEQLPGTLSTVPPEETQVKSEGQERIPALTNVSKVLLH